VENPATQEDFCRISWANLEAQELWEPRIKAINEAWQKLEFESVVHGIRNACIMFVPAKEFVQFSEKMIKLGLFPMAIGVQGSSENYSNCAPAGDNIFRVLVSKKYDKVAILADNLGYPGCCSAHFTYRWNTQGHRDLTLDQLLRDQDEKYSYCNVLLRYLGVRAVPHLPCSYGCEKSQKFGNAFIQLGNKLGFEDEMDWLRELLGMPISYSSLHGVAEIKNRVVKLTVNAPYEPSEKHFHIKFGTYTPVVDNHTANGFSSAAGMEAAHAMILEALAGIPVSSILNRHVIDLGCGNGLLLGKIKEEYSTCNPTGVEIDGRKVLVIPSEWVMYGDINTPEEYRGGVCIISQERINEGFNIGKVKTDYLIVYSYAAIRIDMFLGWQVIHVNRVPQPIDVSLILFKNEELCKPLNAA